jgi:hypothetical protein
MPHFTAVEERWGGGEIYKYNDARIENVVLKTLGAFLNMIRR